jgi:hypothetical protein
MVLRAALATARRPPIRYGGPLSRRSPAALGPAAQCARRGLVLVLSDRNRLSVVAPDIAEQWDASRNGGVRPEDVMANSNAKFWFACHRGPDHVWEASPRNRVLNGHGCPCCKNVQLSVTNSLAVVAPAVAAQWHPTLNGTDTPCMVLASSSRTAWFVCDAAPDHVWQAAVNRRVREERGCPFCAGRRLCASNSLAAVAPGVAAQWHPTRNGDRTPRDVLACSNERFWFVCDAGADHEWEASLRSRTRERGRGCPFCSGLRASTTNSLAARKPGAAALWHPTMNGEVTPSMVVAGSRKKFWFVAPDEEGGAGRPAVQRALRNIKE